MNLHDWMQAHPWLTIGATVALAGASGLLLCGKFRRARRRVAALREAPRTSTGAPFDQFGVWKRARRGARIGLMVPEIFTVPIALIYLIGGRYQLSRGTSTDFLVLVIAYPLGAVIAGAVIGAGRPWMKSFARAALVCSLALLPLLVGIDLSMEDGMHRWGSANTELTVGLSVVLGMALAYGMMRGMAKSAAAHIAHRD